MATVWLAGCVVIVTEPGFVSEPLVDPPPQAAAVNAITLSNAKEINFSFTQTMGTNFAGRA